MRGELALVVGTTPDYVELIRTRWPGRCLFLTDFAHRAGAVEPAPPPGEELLAELKDFESSSAALCSHLERYGQKINGVACYDCESLLLASRLALELGLPFNTPEAISLSRNKYLSKIDWHMDGVPCPRVALASSSGDIEKALQKTSLPAVLKPMTGAGSELVFICGTKGEAEAAFAEILGKLQRHGDCRMYPMDKDPAIGASPREAVLVEELIEGEEYSCEFVLEGRIARVFRTARKVKRLGPGASPLTFAYAVPAGEALSIPHSLLEWSMGMAAVSLGFSGGILMADFFVEDGRPVILEMTPRPSGDCLPHLTRAASGLDTIGLCLDLAQNLPFALPQQKDYKNMAGLRLLADREGVIKSIDASKIAALPEVRELFIRRKPGHIVRIPPDDYDSFVLGHAIFEIGLEEPLEDKCREIEALLGVEYLPR